jgi:hypothetical protein
MLATDLPGRRKRWNADRRQYGSSRQSLGLPAWSIRIIEHVQKMAGLPTMRRRFDWFVFEGDIA